MNERARAIQDRWNREASAEARGMFDKRSSNYLYVIGAVNASSPIKIGMAEDPQRRLSELQCGSPVRLEIKSTHAVGTRQTAKYIEATAHAHFAKSGIHGEWFEIAAEVATEFLSTEAARNSGRITPK